MPTHPLPDRFVDLSEVAGYLRRELLPDNKKIPQLIYAYNGTGKTRLSTEFKNWCNPDSEGKRDTLYFNAFTEDLFRWDNDLDGDEERFLQYEKGSRFFAALDLEKGGYAVEGPIRRLLGRYATFDFKIEPERGEIRFNRGDAQNIKISRGEQGIFLWCFFLAVVQIALGEGAGGTYSWVKYVYVDDPISSLDDDNVVYVAHHLADVIRKSPPRVGFVVSTHHVLFFNALHHSLEKVKRDGYFFSRAQDTGSYRLATCGGRPLLQHLDSLRKLQQADASGEIHTYHFNMLRRIMEQTAAFMGYEKWQECVYPLEEDDPEETIRKRIIDVMSHGDYALYEPKEMNFENKDHFRKFLKKFLERHPFHPVS